MTRTAEKVVNIFLFIDFESYVMSNQVVSPPTLPQGPNLGITFQAYIELVRILRKECPWDRKQTHESLSHLLIEESYETLDAIQQKNFTELKKELGDLLLHIAMHSEIANEDNKFSIEDVIRSNFNKLVHRHPHVFGDKTIETSDDVKRNWEQLKKQEGRTSTLEGVPQHLPALLRAQRIQEKVSAIGFDWKDTAPMLDKIKEEVLEFVEAMEHEPDKASLEFGDILFSLVNAGRFFGISPEKALQATNDKFTRRFNYVEKTALAQSRKIDEMSLDEMDLLWDEAKKLDQIPSHAS